MSHNSSRDFRRGGRGTVEARKRRRWQPTLLALEDRRLLSTIVVNNPTDTPVNGEIDLRQAIDQANSNGGDQTIVFDKTVFKTPQTITLTGTQLELSDTTGTETITGPAAGVTVSGGGLSRVFQVDKGVTASISGLTITGGKTASNGGGLYNFGTITLTNCTLSGNQAVGDANGNALGGAVYNSAEASLTIDNTSFVNNQTNGTNDSFGGAIVNGGTLSINGATFTGNSAVGSTMLSQGGAIGNQYGATATITLSAFTGNQALGSGTGSGTGGAIQNGDELVTPPNGSVITCDDPCLSVPSRTTLVATGGSGAGQHGGAGGAIEDASNVNLAVLNCSFTGNQANGGAGSSAYGGAIDNSSDDSIKISGSQFISNSAIGSGVGAFAFAGAVDNFQTMTIANSSFTGNSAVAGAMGTGTPPSIGQAGGGAILTEGVLTLSNSTVAGNEAVGGSGGNTLTYPVYADPAFGGGINNSDGTLNVTGCTITGNRAIGGASAQGGGGGAFGGRHPQ